MQIYWFCLSRKNFFENGQGGATPPSMTGERVLVVGASRPLGVEIVRALRAAGHAVDATYRTYREEPVQALDALGANTSRLDIADHDALEAHLQKADAAIFIPILTVSQIAAPLLRDGVRAVFFSSNNVAIDYEADVYARLRKAEETVQAAAPQAVILRPTMIYGYPGDGNISTLMAAMRRFPVMPMPGDGKAMQQPVYYKDVAKAACDACVGPPNLGDGHTVAGPEAISQRALYAAIADAVNARAAILPAPAALATTAARMIEALSLKPPLSSAQLRRANEDKTPRGEAAILGETSLKEGLAALARDLDARP